MKSYTDIEQSRKLAEILPIESADMFWANAPITVPCIKDGNPMGVNIPCWSLAALLNFLPPYLFEFDRGIDLNIYPHLNGKSWHCSYMPNCIENMKTDKFRLMTSENSLVDACYEMILKLNEFKML